MIALLIAGVATGVALSRLELWRFHLKRFAAVHEGVLRGGPGGAAVGANAGCSTAQAQQATEKKEDARSAMDGGTGAPQGSEAKADAGAGGGVQGW